MDEGIGPLNLFMPRTSLFIFFNFHPKSSGMVPWKVLAYRSRTVSSVQFMTMSRIVPEKELPSNTRESSFDRRAISGGKLPFIVV